MGTPQRIDRWQLFLSRNIQTRALKTAAVVGTLLASINYLDILVQGSVTPSIVFKIILTYCVPYFVAGYSSVSALSKDN